MLDKEEYCSDNDEIPQLVEVHEVPDANTTNPNDHQAKAEQVPNIPENNIDAVTKAEIEREKVLQRSEARRRKILANAKERLAQLNGGVPPHRYDRFADEDFSDPEVKPDIPEFLRPDRQSTPLDGFSNNVYENNNSSNDQADMQHFLSAMMDMKQQNNPPSNVNIWLTSRLHVVLIALLTFVLSIYDNGLYVNGLSIFLIIGICLISELLLFTRDSKLAPIFDLCIMLLGLRPEVTKRVMNLLLLFHNIVTDMGIFVFSFCGISIAYILLFDDSANLVVIK